MSLAACFALLMAVPQDPPIEQAWVTEFDDIVLAAPVGHLGLVIAASKRGEVRAFQAETGEPAWSYDTKTQVVTNLVVHQDRLVVPGTTHTAVLDPRNGRAHVEKGPRGSRIIPGRSRVYLLEGIGYTDAFNLDTSKSVTAFDPMAEKTIWSEKGWGGGIGWGVESDGRLFLGGQDRIFRVDPGAGRRNGEQNLSGLPVALHALAIKEQVVVIGSGLRPVWSLHGKTLKESWILPREEHPRDIPAVLVQGLLLLFPLPKVVALDPKTGRDQWTLNLEAEPQVSWTPPAVRGSEVCVGSRGQLHAIDAKAGKPTWSLMAGSPAERATVPQPAWIGDRLYYSVGRRLHAFKLKP